MHKGFGLRDALIIGVAAVALTAFGAGAAEKQGSEASDTPKEAARPAKSAEQLDAGIARPSVTEMAKVSHHSVTVHGKAIAYTATAGTLTLRDDEGKPYGSIFYTGYTAEGGARRPVTFIYNGGPGSASLWLHMGSFGPVRIRVNDTNALPPPPVNYGPNEYSLIDKSDLVFIDAMGAGYSRPLGDAKNDRFYGVDQDVDTFAKAIERYLTINNRWNSPKYIFGESYGTTRSGALSNKLQEDGVGLNGVIILSSILNYGARQPGMDHVYLTYLPSYAATAWYHHKANAGNLGLAEFVEAARQYADGPYAAALAKGHMISAAEADTVAKKLADFTGLSVNFIKNANLRVDLSRFRKELLREDGVSVGRFDSRFKGIDEDAAGESPDFDASSTAITDAFISSARDYLGQDLGFKTDMEYRPSARLPGFKWDWSHSIGRQQMNNAATSIDLGQAMRQNPRLRVLSLNGYYDMATPFFGTEYDLNHIPLPAAQAKNIIFKYYESGHMAYLNPKSLAELKRDLDAFYDGE